MKFNLKIVKVSSYKLQLFLKKFRLPKSLKLLFLQLLKIILEVFFDFFRKVCKNLSIFFSSSDSNIRRKPAKRSRADSETSDKDETKSSKKSSNEKSRLSSDENVPLKKTRTSSNETVPSKKSGIASSLKKSKPATNGFPSTSSAKVSTKEKSESESTDKSGQKSSDGAAARSQKHSKQHSSVDDTFVDRDCDFCEWKFKTNSTKTKSNNLNSFAKHFISHVKDEQYGEIPELDLYYCPYNDCNSKIVKPFNFMIHLAVGHKELLPRLDRRLKELKQSGSRPIRDSDSVNEEVNRLTAIRAFLFSSPLFDVSSIVVPDRLCNEIDVYQAYEKKHEQPSGKKYLVIQRYLV